MARHEFEEDDTGDELDINPDLTYEVVKTFIGIDEDNNFVFTHRVRLKRHQFRVEQGEVVVVDLEDVPNQLDQGDEQ